MKLSELIKQLQEIEKEYNGREIDVLCVDETLIIREIIEDSTECYKGKFITTLTIK